MAKIDRRRVTQDTDSSAAVSQAVLDQPPTHAEDPILSFSEVGRRIGKHRGTVSRWAQDGLFEVVRMPSGLHGVRQSTMNQFLGGTFLTQREV